MSMWKIVKKGTFVYIHIILKICRTIFTESLNEQLTEGILFYRYVLKSFEYKILPVLLIWFSVYILQCVIISIYALFIDPFCSSLISINLTFTQISLSLEIELITRCYQLLAMTSVPDIVTLSCSTAYNFLKTFFLISSFT